ncbi:MAG: autotransporter domain-containing protein [Alphaproteobacteria bacterium]|nr:autotransporter domain-containing protein [Alphaproteobacteria bacterium]
MIATEKARDRRASLRRSSSMTAAAAALGLFSCPTASAIVSNSYDTDPAGLIDVAGNWGSVGRLFIDRQSQGGAFVCTQTLINPRMVLTAAHCVATGGGVDQGAFYDGAYGSRVGVTFLVNPISGPGGNVQGTFFTTGVVSPYAIVGSDVVVNPSYDGFFEGDVAIVALSQAIPTFAAGSDAAVIDPIALLMSPLDQLEAVTFVGYGNTGDGTHASFASTRRRVGQNVLGYIGSFYNQEVLARPIDDVWLFGPNLDPDYQRFYMTDFDDPHRGTAEANPFDFNAFGGDAVEHEATTGGGDSGGPLFVPRYGGYVQAGTLTGGSRYNVLQPFDTFGGTTAHTPLYLFGNWLALNNPYKYLIARDGDFDWTDTFAWQEVLDPAFVVDTGTGLVNGLPEADAGITADGDPVGTVNEAPYCFFWGDPTYESYYPAFTPSGFLPGGFCDRTDGSHGGIGGPPWGSTGGTATTTAEGEVGEGVPPHDQVSGYFPLPEPEFSPTPAPSDHPPGSGIVWTPRAWVPNNTDGSLATPATYFDVTLGGSGSITLDNFSATVDRLRITGPARRLLIGDNGSLETWLSPEITGGFLTVDGLFTSHRNMWLLSGVVEGSGEIAFSPTSLFGETTGTTLYNIAGVISPGSASTVGTLSITGNVQFTSASTFLVTIGASGADRLDVNPYAVSSGGFVDSDNASLRIVFADGFVPAYGSAYKVIGTRFDGLSGDFVLNGADLPGVLTVRYGVESEFDPIFGQDFGVLTIGALPFVSAATYVSPEQRVIAQALDDIRGQGGYPALADLYSSLDPTSEAQLPAAFEAMTPLNALAATSLAEAVDRLVVRAVADRSEQLISGGGHGMQVSGLQMLGLGPQLASADPYDAMMMGTAAVLAAQEQAASMGQFRLKEGWGGFLNVTTLVDARVHVTDFIGRTGIDSTGGALGIDYSFEDGQGFVGASLSYVTGKTDPIAGLQKTDVAGYGVSLYGGVRWDGAFLTGQVGYSRQSYDMTRVVPLLLGNQTLTADPAGSIYSVEAKAGYDFTIADVGAVTPFLGVTALVIGIDGYTESGGAAALAFEDREVTEIDGRIGLAYKGSFDLGGGTIRPRAAVAYAVDMKSGDNDGLVAAFAGFRPVLLPFPDVERDSGWVEYDVGVAYEAERWGVTLSYYGADNGQIDSGAVSGRVSVAW